VNGRKAEEEGQRRTESRTQLRLEPFKLLHHLLDQRKQPFRFVVNLDVDVEADVHVVRTHQQFDGLAESRNFLMRELVGDELVEDAVVGLGLDAAGTVGGAVCLRERGEGRRKVERERRGESAEGGKKDVEEANRDEGRGTSL
jgi:hypothetical protein